MTPELMITPYPLQPPHCAEYDPHAAEVAGLIASCLKQYLQEITVEHIGSTSIPGCAGKGIVDLMVLYPPEQLEAVKETLTNLGFQRQTVGHMFPESRPMRVGALEHGGRTYRLHVHVIAANSPEIEVLRAFRDRLCADASLMQAYVKRKQEILATGVMDPQRYTGLKSDFVQKVLTGH
jgi:GrpB-like predicted nucleotidyltransferase (UPF0157 family)